MKKILFAFAFTSLAAVLLAVPTVSDVLVRQQWPWREKIRVDFLLDGMGTEDVKFTFIAYNGETSLGAIPAAAVTGDIYADQNGAKCVFIDPAYAPALATLGTTDNFRIAVSAAEVGGQVLYKVIDLTKTRGEEDHIRYITDTELTSGTWGTYQSNPVSGVTSVIWVAPASGTTIYKKDLLVMRRIRPGTFGFGGSAASTTLTKGYWISIFELTAGQYDNVAVTPRAGTSDYPQRGVSQNDMRGSTYSWPQDGGKVDADSYLGRLRTKVGEDGFDLPTEAQWEYACRAGTTDNLIYRADKTLADVAVYKDNANVCRSVGGKSPNAWGLFDMIGNVWEHTLVWFASSIESGYDPVGPVSGTYGNRTVRGGCYASGSGNCTCVSRTADNNTVPGGSGNLYGFRLVQNDNW